METDRLMGHLEALTTKGSDRLGGRDKRAAGQVLAGEAWAP